MNAYCARFRGAPSSVHQARCAVADYARLCGFTSVELSDVVFAAGEALANAVEHGARNLGSIVVTCAYDGHGLLISVHDRGPGFDVEKVPRRDPLSVRGFGITIMRELMDRVTFEDGGTLVRLYKRGPRVAAASASDRTGES